MKWRLVQILVVVAIIQMKLLKAEVEKVSKALIISFGLLGPKAMGSSVQWHICCAWPKGNGVNIPQECLDHRWQHRSFQDAKASPWKSYLLCSTAREPLNDLLIDKARELD